MKISLKLLTASAIIAVISATSSFAASPENKTEYKAKANGGYEVNSTSKATTASETDKEGQRKVDVSVDNDGTVTKTTKTSSSTDPKGLMNAKDKASKTKIKHKADGSVETMKKDENTDAAGTSTEVEAKTTVDAAGNVTTETEKTVDPKGLMNKKVMKAKTVNGTAVKAE